jgi:DNA invertase Pin-like site-specific DNA recombinase
MIVGYCRVGPLEPASRLETQKRALAAIGARTCFCERVGLSGPAPELERAIAAVGRGDTIAVTRPYRLALSTRGVLGMIERLGRRGVGFRILDTPVDTSTTTGRMILGSAPRWSLGISPARSVLRDVSVGWMRRSPAGGHPIGGRAGQNR